MSSKEFHSAAFAPVNIAWIKYMGKEQGKPANPSLSLTLKNTGTWVRMRAKTSSSPVNSNKVSVEFESYGAYSTYLPPEKGIQKIEAFLNRHTLWQEVLQKHGYAVQFPEKIKLFSKNNAPAASGIATSASSFAAITLAYAEILVGKDAARLRAQFQKEDSFKAALAMVAAQGSGSACRSFFGPWVEWADGTVKNLSAQNSAGSTLQWGDLIFLVDASAKTVSSSEAHERVKTSALYAARGERVNERLVRLKTLLNTPSRALQKLVWEESQDMHELFHTSVPPFTYQTALSLEIAQAAMNSSPHAVVTQDAGANIHVFFPLNERQEWEQFARKTFRTIPFMLDEQGIGAQYVDDQYSI